MKYPSLSYTEGVILKHFSEMEKFCILDLHDVIRIYFSMDDNIGFYTFAFEQLQSKKFVKYNWNIEGYTVTLKGLLALYLYRNGISFEYNRESIWRKLWKKMMSFF